VKLLGKVRDRSVRASELFQNAASGGIRERGINSVQSVCARRAELDAVQGEISALGYYYLRGKRVREAAAVLRCNADLFPNSWNVHDSVGEAYAALGDRERALTSYRRALELNPEAKTAQKAVADLEGR